MLNLLSINQTTIQRENKCQNKGLLKMLAWWLKTNLYASLINLLNNIISSNQFVNQHKLHPKAFTRNRSLTFKTTILFLINLLKSSIQNELDKFFKTITHSELPERVVTSSAFTQARKKLSHKAFVELDKAQVKYFYDNHNYNRWHGFRLIAIDSSTLILPKNEETIKEFGQFSHSPKTTPVVMGRVSQYYDVLNNISIESILSPLSKGELDLAAEHIKAADKDDLLLFDRGYNAFWLFNMILSRQTNFCVRINTSWWKAAQELLSSGLREGIFKIYPTQEAKKKSEKLSLPAEPIGLRFILIELPDGAKEMLATSLQNKEKYPYEFFADLYHNRWPVEESYKVMKSRIEMENFTGKSSEAVRQDYHARIFTTNLTSILSFPVNERIKKKKNKYVYQLNWTQAIARMKDSIVLLFIRENIQKIIKILHNLFFSNSEPIRPNRKFQRKKFRPKNHYYMAYKPIS
jgi:hypothetical protein